MNDEPEVIASPSPEPASEPAPATLVEETVAFARLREAALALSGHPQWVVDGAARTNGWTEDTMLTRQGFNDAIGEWLKRPVVSAGSTAPADTTS